MKKTQKSLKKWVRFSLLIIILALFAVSSYLVINSMSITKKQKQDVLYAYKIKQDLDYKVFLFKNSFIEDEYLEKNEEGYISDLVKNISTNFKYEYQASDATDLKYTYDIKALIQGEYKLEDGEDKSTLWTKEYQLLDEKTVQLINTTQFSIDENVDVDYHTYDEIVSSFRQDLKLPISANLYIIMNVKVSGKIDKEEFNNSKVIKMNVPLNQQAFNISEDYEKDDKDSISTTIEETTKKDNKDLYKGLVLGGVALFLFIISFKKIFNIKEKSYYEQKRDKYLKEYGDVIIEVVTPVTKKDLKIITVKDLSELVDLEEELRIPIVFYEDPDDYEGEFTIVHDDIIYEYILTNEEDE